LTPERTVHGGRPVLVWRLDPPRQAVATAPLGGGLGLRSWVLNAQVGTDYARTDPDAHLAEMAADLGLAGEGVGLLTAADLTPWAAADSGVTVWATVGITEPAWAAAGEVEAGQPVGTINVVADLPAALSDAALVNAVATATEAKAQALFEAGVQGTGTASDAVCLLSRTEGEREPFGGPRSRWGAPLARAVHRALAEAVVPR
jgi:adenosylcobinamide amidohydrolase